MGGRWKDVTHDELKTVHVVPVGDLRAHRERGITCWCQPKVETFDGGGRLVTHNSMDGRELIEKHGVQ
jgi:hypothetical protein